MLAPVTETKTLRWASDEQRIGFEYGPYPLCLSGGFGSGKTVVACLKLLYLMSRFPNSRWLVARRKWVDLTKTTMQTFFKLCPPQAYSLGRRSDQEKILVLNNGSTVYWQQLDDPEIATVIQGVEINGFFIDQAEEIDEEIFEKLSSRVGRWDQAEVPDDAIAEAGGLDNWAWKNFDGQAQVPPYIIIACNPDNELHWIYRRFHPDSPEWSESPGIGHDGKPIPSYKDQGYLMLTMPSDSNRFLTKAALQQLSVRDESFQKRFRRGEWGIPEGQIHVVSDLSLIPGTQELVDKIKRTSVLHRSLDHGDTAPTVCAWYAVDRQGNIWFYREYYQPDKRISDHRFNVWKMSGDESYVRQLADPSIFDQSAQKGGEKWSVAEEWADTVSLDRRTAVWWEPADNNELGTRNRINEYLAIDPDRVHPITGQKGSPRLFFITRTPEYPQGCDEIVKDVRSQRRERIGMSLGKPIFSDERDGNVRDHGYDVVRYAVASRPSPSKESNRKVPARSFEGIRRQIKLNKRNGLHAKLASMAKYNNIVRSSL